MFPNKVFAKVFPQSQELLKSIDFCHVSEKLVKYQKVNILFETLSVNLKEKQDFMTYMLFR